MHEHRVRHHRLELRQGIVGLDLLGERSREGRQAQALYYLAVLDHKRLAGQHPFDARVDGLSPDGELQLQKLVTVFGIEHGMRQPAAIRA